MKNSLKMVNKRVLVTGSGTGIGRETALEFAREGAQVVFHYVHSEQGAVSAVDEVEKMGGKAIAFRANFSELSEVMELAQKTVEFLGGIDVLINNAGITMNLPFEKITPDQFDILYKVNVRAPFFLIQKLLPELTISSGAIVNITSIHAFEGSPEHSVYAGTKGAIVAYTRELAIELALKGVRVNAIAPGATNVENHYKVVPGFDPIATGKMIPCGFMGEPLDIARAIIFLASDDARYIVGQTIIVDGGTTSWMPFGNEFREPNPNCFGKGYVPGI